MIIDTWFLLYVFFAGVSLGALIVPVLILVGLVKL